jgi:hypothetical protein
MQTFIPSNPKNIERCLIVQYLDSTAEVAAEIEKRQPSDANGVGVSDPRTPMLEDKRDSLDLVSDTSRANAEK